MSTAFIGVGGASSASSAQIAAAANSPVATAVASTISTSRRRRSAASLDIDSSTDASSPAMPVPESSSRVGERIVSVYGADRSDEPHLRP